MAEQVKMFAEAGDEVIDKKLAEGKSGLTAKQQKAIKWYIETHRYGLRLSNPPMQMHFSDASGRDVTVTLETILNEYHEWNEEDKRRRSAERKKEKELEKQRGRLRV
jgi:hypothetical protein